MTKRHYYIFVVALWLMSSMTWAQGVYYASNQLQQISMSLGLSETIMQFPDGVTYYTTEQPLTICKRDGCVEHIGYTLFSSRQRAEVGEARCNFLERFLLTLNLPLKREKSIEQEMKEEKIIFRVGNLSTLNSFIGDTTLNVSAEVLKGKAHAIKWSCNDKTVCEVGFPINHELMRGIYMQENDDRLQMDVLMTHITDTLPPVPDISNLTKRRNIFVAPGDVFARTSLTGNRYYTELGDSMLVPLFSSDKAVESVANIFTGNDVTNDYQLEIKQVMYGYQEKTFTVPLQQWVSYYKNQGCIPYFGSISSDTETIECLLIMQHPMMGYCHLMRIKFDITTMDSRSGTIKARLNPFIPTSHIKDLNLIS